jgi:xylulose-5-phosphate/fructose-6-phosphate phosphoketolase
MASAPTKAALREPDAYWRAAHFLSVGPIFLWKTPLLKRPLSLSDVKPMLPGNWGTTSGQNFVYAQLNRVIKVFHLNCSAASVSLP